MKSSRSFHILVFIASLTLAALGPLATSSQAIVGYVNVTIATSNAPVTYALIANPLDVFPSNSLSTVMPSVPEFTQVYFYRGNPAKFESHLYLGGQWIPDTTVNPGEGFIIALDRAHAPSPTTITFVGILLQGSLANPIPPGYSLRASMAPLSGGITTVLHLPPSGQTQLPQWDQNQLFQWSTNGQMYSSSSPFTYDFSGSGGWINFQGNPSEPILRVAESFFYHNFSGVTDLWIVDFTANIVQPLAQPASSGPQIQSLRVSADTVTLDLGEVPAQPYQVEFSADGINWTVIATGQKQQQWVGSNPGGAQGYYRVN